MLCATDTPASSHSISAGAADSSKFISCLSTSSSPRHRTFCCGIEFGSRLCPLFLTCFCWVPRGFSPKIGLGRVAFPVFPFSDRTVAMGKHSTLCHLLYFLAFLESMALIFLSASYISFVCPCRLCVSLFLPWYFQVVRRARACLCRAYLPGL